MKEIIFDFLCVGKPAKAFSLNPEVWRPPSFFSVCVYYIAVRLLSGYILSMLLHLSSFRAEPLTWFISKMHLWTFVCEMSHCLFLSCVSLVKITKCVVVQMRKTKRKRAIKLLTLPAYHCAVDICNVLNYFNIKVNFL